MLATTDHTGPHSAVSLARSFARDFAYLTIGLVTSIVAFCVWVTGLTVALSFAILIVGIPVAIAVFWAFRLIVELDRRNAALMLGAPIRGSYRSPRTRGWLERLRVTLSDPQSWRDLAWLIVHSILGFAFGVAIFALAGLTLTYLSLPAWEWALPEDERVGAPWTIDSVPVLLATWLLWVPAAAATVALARPMALGQSALARALLGRRTDELEQRVERLAETRAGAVSAATEQLERIERDLHDGAQARLVALAVDLGLAQERFDENPEQARALIAEAGEEAKRTLAELRDLARGMRPALLAERGLVEAVRALAARTPLAVTVEASVDGEPTVPREIETAAYFVVAEGLANVAKHSRAARAEVTIARPTAESLAIEIRDDGVGGADPSGAGLDGLRRRVEALDGRLSVLTGAGEGTSIRAELPCAR